MNTNKPETFSEEIRRETVRHGGWGKKDWQGKVLVVLIFGVPSGMTRIEFKTKCDEVGVYCFPIGKVEQEGGILSSHAKTESENGVAEDRHRKWVRILGRRACIVNGIAKLRRGEAGNTKWLKGNGGET